MGLSRPLGPNWERLVLAFLLAFKYDLARWVPCSVPLNITLINERVDRALSDNRRAENIVIIMATSIFGLGAFALLFSYKIKNPYVAGGSTICQGFLYWPIREVLKLRRDNVLLQAFPALVSSLPASALANEIRKMLEYLRR
jgi:hypothetical protein